MTVSDLPAELASRLTRSGFPDTDLAPYFEPNQDHAEREEIEELIKTITDGSSG